MRHRVLVPLFAAAVLAACSNEETAQRSAADVFWASLQTLCGQAFTGTLVESVPPDPSFEGQELVMHVRQCEGDVVRVPFHLGEDRSRTWVISRTSDGLRLKHDHRHEDGAEDRITQYGGDTTDPGGAERQEFLADAHTKTLVPAAATNVWILEIHPGEMFAYALRREGFERRFRVEFDLSQPVPAPPPPWGS